MSRPFELVLTEEEKKDLQDLSLKMGMSVSEVVNYALAKALESDATGVHFAGDE